MHEYNLSSRFSSIMHHHNLNKNRGETYHYMPDLYNNFIH